MRGSGDAHAQHPLETVPQRTPGRHARPRPGDQGVELSESDLLLLRSPGDHACSPPDSVALGE